MRRLLLFFSFMILGVGLLYGVARWVARDNPSPIAAPSQELTEGTTRLSGMQMEMENPNGQVLILQARQGLLQDGKTYLEGVKFQLRRGQKNEGSGNSGKAVWHKSSGKLFFSDGVQLDRAGENWQVVADTMLYEVNDELVSSKDAVLIESEYWVQRSQGFQLFLQEGRVELRRPVLVER